MARAETGQSESLFDEAEEAAASAAAPLAVRMRPRTLDEVIGQRHLTGAGTPFRKLIDNDAPMSLLLWGPPGTGKTTLAYVVSQVTRRRFVELSAVSAGVKDVRAAVDAARRTLGMNGAQTVLFIDEVHRFSKTQQDALLPAVENRWVSFIGATTENPFFSVVSPLLSRSLLLTLQPLSDDDVREVIGRALADPGRAGSAARSCSTRRPPSIWSGWPAATPGARSPTWRPPRSACPRAAASIPPRWSARWTGPRSATTGTAISTTT